MKKLLLILLGIAVLTSPVVLQAGDITSPGDSFVGVPADGRWPGGEPPEAAFDDNVGTKYLNFRAKDDGGVPVGYRITPSRSQTIVGGLTFTTANDSPDRDPATYVLSGSNDSINGPYTLIASGEIVDFTQGTEWPRDTKGTTPILFFGDYVAYDHYEILIRSVRNFGGANSMQIAEIELLELPENGWPPQAPEANASGDRLLRIPTDMTLQADATVSDLDTAIEDLTYNWTLMSGPATVNFNGTENGLSATVTFPQVAGIYELLFTVTDTDLNDANDVVVVRVWDPATEDEMLGHWALNDGPESMIATDSTGNNDGVLSHHATGGGDPNWAVGWIPSEAPDNWALDFTDLGFVKVDPNELFESLDPEWSITVAAWVRAINWDGNHRVLQKGLSDNQYRLLAEGGSFVFHLAGVGRIEAPLPAAGLWHHVAGTYDGATMKLWIDGAVAGSLETTGLINTSDDALYIGTKSEFVDPVAYPNDYLVGLLDDVRIYNYPLSDDDMLALVAMGENAAPTVRIVDPEELVLSVRDYIDLDVTVIDANGDEITMTWTFTGPADVTFEPGGDADNARVVFTEAGTYTLRLTVADAMFGLGGEIFDEVTVTVTNPTCADVIAAGFEILGDFNNDCRVNLGDLAIFAQSWMVCVDTSGDPECDNPWR